MPRSHCSDHSRVPGLDLLRLLAVAAVIFYHYGFWGPASHGVPQVALPYLASYAQYGFLGVPIFFTISGFVIAYSAEGRTTVGFAIARFSRIYPTFLFCMTLTFAIVLLLGGPHFEVTFAQWLANLTVAARPVAEDDPSLRLEHRNTRNLIRQKSCPVSRGLRSTPAQLKARWDDGLNNTVCN